MVIYACQLIKPMDALFDTKRIHPAAAALRRANANRAARQIKTAQTPAPVIQLTPCLGERDFLYGDITGAWLVKYPNYPLHHSLIKFYGCLHLWQLSTAQLREFLDSIK